jgi:ABC-2 type transport system ATP-binding protein
MEFLRFVAGLYREDGATIEHRARELLALFDLEDWRDELVESYSHGMRQKLIISSAFVHRPDVIVVDEPMVGLDPKAAAEFLDIMAELRTEGKAVLMSTHDIFRAKEIGDRVGIMKEGRLVMERTRGELQNEDLNRIYIDYMESAGQPGA